MGDEKALDTREVPVSPTVVERVAERSPVDGQAISDALVELYPELLGRHAKYERTSDFVTVDGTRAYRVDTAEWDGIADEFSFNNDLATAVQVAHTEQAGLLFARAVGADDVFHDDESGIVIGIDTAEQF